MEIAVTHVDAVLHLAQPDSALILPAAAASRSAYEAAFIAAWLLEPTEPIERERRWLGYLQNHIRFYKNLSDEFATRAPKVSDAMKAIQQSWQQQADQFANQLPAGAQTPVKYPGVQQAIDEKKKQYFMYREVSQLVHSEAKALSYAPRTLKLADAPTHRPVEYALHSPTGDWAIVIGMAGEAVIWPLEEAIRRLSDYSPHFAAKDWNQRFLQAVDRLARTPAASQSAELSSDSAAHRFDFGRRVWRRIKGIGTRLTRR